MPIPMSAPTPATGAPWLGGVRDPEFISRATNGYTRSAHRRVRALGRSAWLQEETSPDATEDPVVTQGLAQLPALNVDGPAYFQAYASSSGAAARELGQATILRAVHSKWQLRERMVDFWHDHFHVTQPANNVTRLCHRFYDADVIRAHVFGNFGDMLLASAKSASMLNYLDGDDNVSGAPNENYAREVMELHTLGVNGPYTETDVSELARCLTGWDHYGLAHPTTPAAFDFRANRHDNGTKSFLGLTIAPAGVQEGEIALAHLANHPTTADFVSRKLVRRFVSEYAPEAAIAIVRTTWIQTGGDLGALTRALFSDAVADLAKPWAYPKTKRPFQFFAGLARSLEFMPDQVYRAIPFELESLGQRPFFWPAPNGFPDSSAVWSGDLYSRWNLAVRCVNGSQNTVVFDNGILSALVSGVDPSAYAKWFGYVLTGDHLDQTDIEAAQAWFDSRPGTVADVRDLLGILVCSPSYQTH